MAIDGALLNRVRGKGLFDFGGNKLLFSAFSALFARDIERRFAYLFLPPILGQRFRMGTYIGALFGTAPSQAEDSRRLMKSSIRSDNAAR